MAYMGFGMRKEVYTRKAKKVFSKLKGVYRDGVTLPSSNIKFKTNKKASYKKHSYKPFYKSTTYKAIKYVVLSGVAAVLIWDFLIQEHYHDYKQRQFEESGFAILYQEELNHFNQVFEYMDTHRDRIISMKYSSYYGFTILLKHPKTQYRSDNFTNQNLSFEGKYKSPTNYDSINNNTLYINREKRKGVYEDLWIYHLEQVKNNQIPKSVKSYLNLSNTILNNIIKASKHSDTFRFDGKDITTQFYHPNFGYYKLVYSDTKPKNYKYERYGDYYEVIIGVLNESTYWSKESKQLIYEH